MIDMRDVVDTKKLKQKDLAKRRLFFVALVRLVQRGLLSEDHRATPEAKSSKTRERCSFEDSSYSVFFRFSMFGLGWDSASKTMRDLDGFVELRGNRIMQRNVNDASPTRQSPQLKRARTISREEAFGAVQEKVDCACFREGANYVGKLKEYCDSMKSEEIVKYEEVRDQVQGEFQFQMQLQGKTYVGHPCKKKQVAKHACAFKFLRENGLL